MKPNPGMDFKRPGFRKWVANLRRHHWGSFLCLFCYRKHKKIMIALCIGRCLGSQGFYLCMSPSLLLRFWKCQHMRHDFPSSSFSVCPFEPKLTFSTAKPGYRSSNGRGCFGEREQRGRVRCPCLPSLVRPDPRGLREKESLSPDCLHMSPGLWVEGYCRVGLFHSSFTVVPFTL